MHNPADGDKFSHTLTGMGMGTGSCALLGTGVGFCTQLWGSDRVLYTLGDRDGVACTPGDRVLQTPLGMGLGMGSHIAS